MGKKDIRSKFRNDVFTRDKFKCKLCGKSDTKLDAHHITNREEMPNQGYVISNGITLCDNGEDGCHYKVEKFYFSNYIKYDFSNLYHPKNLYSLIGSNLEKAINESKKLK